MQQVLLAVERVVIGAGRLGTVPDREIQLAYQAVQKFVAERDLPVEVKTPGYIAPIPLNALELVSSLNRSECRARIDIFPDALAVGWRVRLVPDFIRIE